MKKEEKRINNKNLIIIAIATLIVLAVFGFVFYKVLGGANKVKTVDDPVVLDAEYKNTDGNQIEISKQTEDIDGFLSDLIEKEKSFAVYVSLPICSGDTAKFKTYVMDFQHKNNLSFYYITSDYVKDTSIYKTVKYFPSVILYKDGKIAKYLRYDSDEDLEYYKSYDGFAKWMRTNVKF